MRDVDRSKITHRISEAQHLSSRNACADESSQRCPSKIRVESAYCIASYLLVDLNR